MFTESCKDTTPILPYGHHINHTAHTLSDPITRGGGCLP